MQILRADAFSSAAGNGAAALVKLREVAEGVVGFASTFGDRLRSIGNPATAELARQLDEKAILARETLGDPDASFFRLATVIGMTNTPAAKGKNDLQLLAERVETALRTCNE